MIQKLIIDSVTIIDDSNVKDINFKEGMPEKLDQTIFEQQNTQGGVNVTYTGDTKKNYKLRFEQIPLSDLNTLLTYANVPISYRVEIITEVATVATDIFDGYAYLRIDRNTIEKTEQYRSFTLEVQQI